MKIQRALISVSDKAGVIDFAKALADLGVEILSTGGTSKVLRDAGLKVKDVSEFTGFPEMLDGRVKTLHPGVHAGLLYLRDNDEHIATMKKHGLQPIDLVCVNLYPFEATVARPGVSFDEAVENIDIGGPAMLRSAAKNHKFVTVVTDPVDYPRVLASIKENGGNTTPELRIELAHKVYAQQARYDAAIASYLSGYVERSASATRWGVGRPLVVAFESSEKLRYGENPHQEATFYRDARGAEACVAHAQLLHGKEMSYNNFVDADAALEAVRELSSQPAAAIIKHNNPCGYATGATLSAAFEAAWAGDVVSAFGSVIAVTQPVDLATAKCLEGRFVEVLIAPGYDAPALEFLKSKSKNLRILKLHKPLLPAAKTQELKQINGGMLVQDKDIETITYWMNPTAALFPEEKKMLAEFGIKACKFVKSNAIAIVREYEPGQFMMLGMGAGQPNRVDSLRKLAVPKAEENIELLFKRQGAYGKSPKEFRDEIVKECVLVSDAFFPFPDNIDSAADTGIRYIVQPGGSKKDEEVIAACDSYGIAMVFTGMRHFKH